eukprot:scaffold228_cov312-Pinguiococcus_pyrenoidosus.AAC.73
MCAAVSDIAEERPGLTEAMDSLSSADSPTVVILLGMAGRCASVSRFKALRSWLLSLVTASSVASVLLLA